MKKVLVTGGAGFIGSHLSRKLISQKYQVTILDDFSSGKRDSIIGLLSRNNLSLVQGSVTNLTLLREAFRGIDYVFHLAGTTSVIGSIERPQVYNRVNITGTLNVLLAARDANVKKVVFASSCAVYGNTGALPVREDFTPNPQSPYAVTKLTGEWYCQVFSEVYRLSTICLRYFNVYGPGQDTSSTYASVIPRFVKLIAQGNPPIIFGDGEQTRDFIFVEDVIEATILASQTDENGVYNIGSGQSVSINALADIIPKLMRKHGKPIYNRPRPGEIRHIVADISRARGIGYEPKWTLNDGLAATIKSLV